jgi:hypothetical protein
MLRQVTLTNYTAGPLVSKDLCVLNNWFESLTRILNLINSSRFLPAGFALPPSATERRRRSAKAIQAGVQQRLLTLLPGRQARFEIAQY